MKIQEYKIPIIASIVAIAITVTMDFTGYFNFSALPLLAISLVFWLIYRLSASELGLTIGKLKYYGIALLYPASVLGVTTLIAYLFGNVSTVETDWPKANKMMLLSSTIGMLMVLLTEEGFFRGWLWGAFRKLGMSSTQALCFTTGIFMLWHISSVTSGTDYSLPFSQIPVYLINVVLLGAIWGLMRSESGSVLVPALSHAVWNALAYTLFGFGEKSGALGIELTHIFGPEVGYLGILLNGLFLFWLWNNTKTMR